MQHLICLVLLKLGFPGGSVVKNLPTNAYLIPGSGRSSGQRKWQYTPIFSPGKSHGERGPAGYSPWAHERAGHDLATKQQQQQCVHIHPYFSSLHFKMGYHNFGGQPSCSWWLSFWQLWWIPQSNLDKLLFGRGGSCMVGDQGDMLSCALEAPDYFFAFRESEVSRWKKFIQKMLSWIEAENLK